jgi:hypothetical protein
VDRAWTWKCLLGPQIAHRHDSRSRVMWGYGGRYSPGKKTQIRLFGAQGGITIAWVHRGPHIHRMPRVDPSANPSIAQVRFACACASFHRANWAMRICIN